MKKLNKQAFAFILKKAGLSYGLPTFALCAIIYYFISRPKEGMSFYGVANDLYIAVFVTCFICSILYVLTLKGELKKGKIPDMTGMDRPLYAFVPKNAALHALILSIMSTVIYAFIPAGICALVCSFAGKELVFNGTLYWILKSIYSGVFITLHMFKSMTCAITNAQN